MELKLDPSAETPATLRALATFLITMSEPAELGETIRVSDHIEVSCGDLKTLERYAPTQAEAEKAFEFFNAEADRQQAEQTDPLPVAGGMQDPYLAGIANKADWGTPDEITPASAHPFLHPEELVPVPESDIPPSPAPSIAAATLFPIAPAVPQAGAVPPPPVPAPPVAPTPPAAPAATGAPAPGVELDVTGLPWSDRIHSSTKAKNANGTWRARRNLNDAELVKNVENELRALMAIPAAAPGAVPPPPLPRVDSGGVPTAPQTQETPAANIPVPTAPTMAPPVPPAPTVTEVAGSTQNPVSAPVPAPPVPPAPPINAFAALMKLVSSSITAQKLQPTQVHAALERQGVPGDKIGMLSNRPDLAALVLAELSALVGAV